MAAEKWLPEDTITEVELPRQARLGAVTEMIVEQTRAGYQVIVRLKWHPNRVALRTRRSEDEPRIFKSLERLVEFIRDRFPVIRELSIVLMPSAQLRKRTRKSAAKR